MTPRRTEYSGWRRLGDLLIEKGSINVLQLQTALLEQNRTGERLGAILLSRGWISPSDLMRTLAEQQGINLWREPAPEVEASSTDARRSGLALGRLLVARGRISEEELERALEEQTGSGRRLGEILHDSGAVSAALLADALAEQQGKRGDLTLWQRAQSQTPDELVPLEDDETGDAWFELREHQGETRHRLYASSDFIDTSDLALAVLDEWEPDQLEIVRVAGGGREEVCWQYPPT